MDEVESGKGYGNLIIQLIFKDLMWALLNIYGRVPVYEDRDEAIIVVIVQHTDFDNIKNQKYHTMYANDKIEIQDLDGGLINNPVFDLSRNQMIKWRDIKIDVQDFEPLIKN